ncbi:hypothetical protein [Paeniglutamicibacter sp. Y32M11]|uniref:hypothetical protein n=1 Tax=Paeniglutamicibacter sp. Y32M11 TaxID=2853258 RepID=UPI001C528FAF|nr:hypothetical protein [Paeniglutamicibacter sp. Y32M11]QXQ08910.1 hypothetical protein KUF55_10235 [Paeniglutamicibacter sp. Y32M11]
MASWTAKGNVTAHGASGIGFLNFGAINAFSAEGPIKTIGNGSVGIRLSRELPKPTIRETVNRQQHRRIATHGHASVAHGDRVEPEAFREHRGAGLLVAP